MCNMSNDAYDSLNTPFLANNTHENSFSVRVKNARHNFGLRNRASLAVCVAAIVASDKVLFPKQSNSYVF